MSSSTSLERQFVWTVIPSGRVTSVPGGSEPMAVFSVLLTPRLIGPHGGRLTVADFGMQSWPEQFAALAFDVFRGPQQLPSMKAPYVALDGTAVRFPTPGQPAAWKAVFPADMPVEPYQATSYDGRDTRRFPAGEASAAVRGLYTATAQAHAAHHGAAPENDAGLRDRLRAIGDLWQTGLSAPGVEPARAPEDQPALARAYAFYRRGPNEFHAPERHATPAEAEFHDTVAHLVDHPVVLRALGLLTDLAVPASRLGQVSTANPAELRVVPRWNPVPNPPPGWSAAGQSDLGPSTAYTLTGTRFVPASVDGATSTGFNDGMLPLTGTRYAPSNNARFEVLPFDVDGAALRLVSTARSDAASPPPATGASTPAGALPALHSMGLALVDRDREAEHHKQLARAQDRATPSGLLSSALLADSLLGGYRLDVFDDTTNTWHSLCRRRVHYTIGGVPIGPGTPAGLLDEGYLRPGGAATGAGPSDVLYLHETVARWDGWSLVAQRPERTVATGDAPPVPLSSALGAVVECDPGSLPRLRFGRDYWLRVRIADLAGGGLRADEVGATEEQTDKLTYYRFEPMPPPELVPTRAFDDGDGQDRMIIRSDRGVSVDQYAAAHGYRAYDLRHLLPPKCSLALAMQYDGTFDKALGPTAAATDVTRLFAAAQRADRELTDVDHAQTVGTDPASGVPSPYVIVPETDVAVPWLVDPSSSFIAMNARPRPIGPTGEPGPIVPPDKPVIAIWQGTWPGLQSATVKLVPAASGCTVSRVDARHLTVALGPAEQVTFDIPSCLLSRHVQLFGIAQWSGVDPSNPGRDITLGKNRLITPPRTVTMVHAVQRPLTDPSGHLTALRGPGDHDTVLATDGLDIDIPSTGRIDLHSEWTDHYDIPPDTPPSITRQAHVGSYEVQHLPPAEALPEIRQEFGDTRHHHVSYTVTAVSRFEDCFGRALAAHPDACLVTGTLADLDVPCSVRPPAPKYLYGMPVFRWTRTTDGQRTLTRLRQGGGLRVFLERPWYVTGDSEALAVLTLPASSAPDEVLPYLSIAGRDPIRDTGAPPGVLTSAHLNTPEWELVNLPEAQRQLNAGLHQVELDAQNDRWFADLDLAPVVEPSYFPFVRLALARYQKHTVTGVPNVSQVVLTEPLQLAPRRLLTVTRTSGQATVVLDGLGPGGTGNTVRTELQVHDGALTAPADVTGWSTVLVTTGSLGHASVISVPDTGARPQRLVVREFETRPVPAGGDGTGRPVFVDIVPLGTW
ncbi:hypothetical protein ACIRRH_30775 [Kitasatospora sp. NPDC101235]|uniref:hypothetical protein n=1 Tax=Kitasatospora sp. NPDC101235 TaxID=3364101 RepID=UPI00382C1E12